MKPTLHSRALALVSHWMMRAVAWLLRGEQASWARAMRAEVAAIADEREAFLFAWGCLCAACAQAFCSALARITQPQTFGVIGCMAAVLMGCLLMNDAGAPRHYVGTNALSLALALATFWLLPRQRLQQDGLLRAQAVLVIGALLLVACLGQATTGAAGWLRVGPLGVNMVWLLLPALLMAFDPGSPPAQQRWGWPGLLMAFGALALQADAVMAGLAATFFVLRGCLRRSLRQALPALLPLAIALHAAPGWQAPDALPFVDQVLQRGFEQHPAMGLALTVVLTLPLGHALLHRRTREHGCLWALLVALSLPGWLPSPLVGFGGSLIVGHLLSLALLPGDSTGPGTTRSGRKPVSHPATPRPMPRSGLA
jgi:hypothetical protein